LQFLARRKAQTLAASKYVIHLNASLEEEITSVLRPVTVPCSWNYLRNYGRILNFSTPVTGTLFFVPYAESLDCCPRSGQVLSVM
jgi:hypothetical protein